MQIVVGDQDLQLWQEMPIRPWQTRTKIQKRPEPKLQIKKVQKLFYQELLPVWAKVQIYP